VTLFRINLRGDGSSQSHTAINLHGFPIHLSLYLENVEARGQVNTELSPRPNAE
jgi:hypothetical protein